MRYLRQRTNNTAGGPSAHRIRKTRRGWQFAVVLVGGLCAAAVSAPPAFAKIPPPPPLPTPTVPSQVSPYLGLVSPVLSPECANLALAAALVIPALAGDVPGGGLPFPASPLFAPILAICGAVPLPGEELECEGDSTITALATEGITDVLGSEGGLLGKVLALNVFGQTTEEVYVLQSVAPSQLQGVNLGSLVANAFKCSVLKGPAPISAGAPPDLVAPLTPVSGSPLPSPTSLPSTTSLGFSDDSGNSGLATSSTPAVAGASPSAAAQPEVVLPKSTAPTRLLLFPTSTVAQGGAVIGFLLLIAGGAAVFMRTRRAVRARPESSPADGE
jgi:hypothetical protein